MLSRVTSKLTIAGETPGPMLTLAALATTQSPVDSER